jgi:beta-lactamase class A
MLSDLRLVVLGKVLSPSSRERLGNWMVACQTGTARLRAGMPSSWRVADKTGTGAHGSANDIAVVWTPTAPILIASYLTGAEAATPAQRDGAHAAVGRTVAAAFRPGAASGAHG